MPRLLTKRDKVYARSQIFLTNLLEEKQNRIDELESKRITGSTIVLLIFLIVFLLGNLLGHWVSNKLRESTWHSPKGCPLFVRQEK